MMRNESLNPVMVEEPIRLTKEEQDFVRGCLDKQLWSSDLPWGIGSGVLAQIAMRLGYVKRSRITIFSTAVGAFVLSRALSYGECFQKLVQQPGNTIADRLAQKKQRSISGQQPGGYPSQSLHQTPIFEPEAHFGQQPNYLDLDTDRPDYPDIDPNSPPPSGEMQPSKPGQTYEELRRLNREAYQQQLRGARPSSPPPSPAPAPAPTPSQDVPSSLRVRRLPQDSQELESPPYSSISRKKVNKYGDVWDE